MICAGGRRLPAGWGLPHGMGLGCQVLAQEDFLEQPVLGGNSPAPPAHPPISRPSRSSQTQACGSPRQGAGTARPGPFKEER